METLHLDTVLYPTQSAVLVFPKQTRMGKWMVQMWRTRTCIAGVELLAESLTHSAQFTVMSDDKLKLAWTFNIRITHCRASVNTGWLAHTLTCEVTHT